VTPVAVVVAGKEGLRLDALARAVAGFRGVPIQDATIQVRRARGILAEDLDGAGAEELVRRLAAQGVAARALPAGLLAALPRPLLLPHAEPTPAALLARMQGETLSVPWGRIRLVAVAPFTETVYEKVRWPWVPACALTGVPVCFGGKKKIEKAVPTVPSSISPRARERCAWTRALLPSPSGSAWPTPPRELPHPRVHRRRGPTAATSPAPPPPDRRPPLLLGYASVDD
jgi:hypothetical protein